MLLRNREIRIELAVLLTATAILTGIAAVLNCSLTVFLVCAVLGGLFFVYEWYRYRRIRSLSEALDRLLTSGELIPFQDYQEGELSVLSSQIQKLTLRLTEAAEVQKADRVFLADSLADISHQLRTPLTAMNLTAAMLGQECVSDPRRQELAMELKRLLGRTQWLVEALLKFSKLDAGTVHMEPERISLKTLLEKAMEPLSIPMELRELQIFLSCQGETVVDPVWTAEAIGNILKNAMEHTPVGGWIRIKAEKTSLFSLITVEDSGPGFVPEDIPNLFERFYKGKNAAQSGYGIGLALARAIISRQNGTVQAENGENGAVFTIKFYTQVI